MYLFGEPPVGWADGTESAKLTASDGAAGDRFGVSAGISTDGGTLAAGASAAGPGAAYVFTAGAGGGARPTSTSVSCAPGSVAVSQATMCTATVNDTGPDPRATPTGIVTFAGNSHGTFSGPSCALGAGGSCHVDYTPSAADSGIHRITASYRGDGAHTASNGAANLTVNAGDGGSKRPTSTSVVFCIPPTVTVGSSASCRATVTDAGNGPALTPTGTLRFSSNSHGTFAGASCSLAEVNATSAGCNVVYVPSAVDSGTHGLTATYGGDAVHDPSSGRGTLTVRPPALPQNTAPPSIISDQSCQSYFGRLVCRPIPYQYLCQPGQWSGTTPGAPFQFEWQQLYYRRQGVGLTSFWRTEPNGSSQTFYAAPPKLDLVPGAIASGTFRCLVTASGPGGSTTANSPLTRLQVAPSLPSGVPRPTSADVHVTGIEVTQGVQEAPCGGCVFSDPSHVQCETCAAGTLPSRDQANGDTPGNADYTGVTMAAGKQTVVRVYANFSRSNCSRPPCTLAANAQLEVLDSAGHRILLLNPAVNELITPGALRPPSAACPLCVDLATRANPKSSFYFLIPAQDTLHRSVTFRATVTPQVGPILPGQCGGCRGNVFTLHGVPFKQPATLTIWPIPLDDEGIPGSPRTALSLSQIFGSVQAVYPNPVRVLPWDGTLDVEGLGNEDAVEEVEDRASDNDLSSGVYPVGVFFRGESGGLNGTTPRGPGRLFTDDGPPASIVGDFRPLTMVAHEIGHGMALGHADDAHPHPDGSANCGGDSNGQQGEGWPPDFEGRIQGVGLDLRSFSLFQAGSLPTTFVEGFDHSGNSTSNPLKGAKYFDFMSYCPAPAGSGLGSLAGPAGGFPPLQQYTESLYWLSPHNWQRLLDYHAPPQMLPAAADRSGREASGTPLRVIATVKPGGATTIHDVTPGKRLHLGPTPGSPFRIQLRDATGKVLTTVVPATVTIHTDGVARQGLMLAATLPFSPGTAAVVVTGGGQDLARRTRSAHAPTGRFVSPRRGARVGRARTTVVRWTEHDADGDRLTSDVDYSAHGGHSWRVVAGPEHGTSARISSRLLSASQNGRLRVRISDGFNVTTLTSGRFRAAGAPPMVQIVGAPRRGRVLQMALLPLQGSAYDDAGRPLTGRHLTWYLDRRRIGRGEFALAAHLRAGNTTIRLVATDSHGRKAQAVLPLHVKAVAARYLLFDAPLLVSRRARTVKIRIAASGPATFTIVGRRYAVGLRLRSITVHIRRGKQPLRLPCSLRSPGGVVKGTYVALRG
jgi:hypothetical protein